MIEDLFLIAKISSQLYQSFCIDIHGKLFTFGSEKFHPAIVSIPPIAYISSGLCNKTIVQDIDEHIWILDQNFPDEENKCEFIQLNYQQLIVGETNKSNITKLMTEKREKFVSFIICNFHSFNSNCKSILVKLKYQKLFKNIQIYQQIVIFKYL